MTFTPMSAEMNQTPKISRFSIKQKMTLLLSITFVTLIVITNCVHYLHSTNDLKKRIKNNLEETADAMSTIINGDKHAELRTEGDQQLPQYREYFEHLLKVRKKFSKITYVYTMRATAEGKVQYVIDADDGEDGSQAVGTIYEDATADFSTLVKSLKTPTSDDDYMTDKWGTWLSGYAPIFKSDGSLDAILGVDMNAEDVNFFKRQILYTSLLLTLLASIIAIILAHLLSNHFTTPIKALIEQMTKVTDGDYGTQIAVPKSQDELELMANSFNLMSATLGDTFSDLESELQKSRALTEKMKKGEEKLLQSFYFLHQPVLFIENNLIIDCNDASLEFFAADDKIDLVDNEIDLFTNDNSTTQILKQALQSPKEQHLMTFKNKSGKVTSNLISVNQLYLKESYLLVLIIHPNQKKVIPYE